MSALTPCQSDPELWFSTVSADQRRAVAGCQRCPLMDSCRQTAIDNETKWGTWGGLTERELRRQFSTPRKPRKPSVPAPCGTATAYWRHVNNRETCDVCNAWRAADVEADRRRQLAEEHARGGSRCGYEVHRRLGEPPCDMCRNAHAQLLVERRKTKRARTLAAAGTSGLR